jgi:hypothetical protein
MQRGAAWRKGERLPPEIPIGHSRLVAESHIAGRRCAGVQGAEAYVERSALPHAEDTACGCPAEPLDATASGARILLCNSHLLYLLCCATCSHGLKLLFVCADQQHSRQQREMHSPVLHTWQEPLHRMP